MTLLLLNKIALNTSEGKIFRVGDALVKISPTIKCLIDELGTENAIPLSEISSKTLFRIIEYVKKHTDFNVAVSMTSMSESIEAWDAEFVKVDMDTLYELIQATYNLNIQNLYDLVCNTVGKTLQEIRKTFNIKNDFTPEKEEVNRKMYSWAYQ